MGLVGHSALAERLGRNQRFRLAGSLAAAGLMGVVGYVVKPLHILRFGAPRDSGGCRSRKDPRCRRPLWAIGWCARPSQCHRAATRPTRNTLAEPVSDDIRRLSVPVLGGKRIHTTVDRRNVGSS